MNVVAASDFPPVGPCSAPITCSNRQLIAPLWEQLAGSEPPGIACCACAHTLLLSNELCQVALANGSGFGANWFGLVLGLRKCVMICTSWPKKVVKSVASGRAPFTVHEAPPVLVGRQT